MNPLKLGVIGCGSVVREIYRYLYFHSDYSPMIRVEGICDASEENLNRFGEEYGIPPDRRFMDYRELCARLDLDAISVNTPDSLHREPVVHAFECGLDVLLPKPLSDTVEDARAIIGKMRETGRFLGVDFHKREDPRSKEARARYRSGAYGSLQFSTWTMLDKLLVADPNHVPRFFATDDFAAKNTPVSFLTAHVADTFMFVTGLKPREVRATGYRQKLPSLSPIAVDGYDLVDTEVLLDNGAVVHFITGWIVPNSAKDVTMQSAHLYCTDGVLELGFDVSGCFEILPEGVFERNVLFRTFESENRVTGFGIDSPGRILHAIRRFRNGDMDEEEFAAFQTPFALGYETTVVCDAAHRSLAQGTDLGNGAIRGVPVGVDADLEA